jgi:hypothetical protein
MSPDISRLGLPGAGGGPGWGGGIYIALSTKLSGSTIAQRDPFSEQSRARDVGPNDTE